MSEALLVVQGLTKHFHTKRGLFRGHLVVKAVDEVSFEVPCGRTLGLVGETGCGKTTLARCILRLLEPTQGQVLFEGRDILKLEGDELRRLRRKMQIVFQNPFLSLDPRMRIRDIVGEPLITHTSMRDSRLFGHTATLLERVGLERGHIYRYPHELSGGQNQRVALARAIALEPSFIILDEPTSSVDVSIQARIINLLVDLQRELGLTYLFISHDLSVVRYVSDRIAVMYLGKIVETGQSDAIFQRPYHPYTKLLLASIPVPDPDVEVETKVPRGDLQEESPPEGCSFYPRCPYRMDVCKKAPVQKLVQEGHQVACHLYQ